MAALLHLVARQTNESEPVIVPVPGPVPVPVPGHPSVRHGSPVVAFIIGLSIIILASVLNAAGLNLTKLDHVLVPLSFPRFISLTAWYVPAGPK